MNMEKYQRIRDLREDADLTQQQVGEAINVPQRTYAYYESGQRMIPPHILCALADYYKVSVDYILGRTDEKRWTNSTTEDARYVNLHAEHFILRGEKRTYNKRPVVRLWRQNPCSGRPPNCGVAIWFSGSELLYMGGLYVIPPEAPLAFLVILMRPVAESIAFIHDRMPVIVPQKRMNDWLSPRVGFEELMKDPVEDMVYKAV